MINSVKSLYGCKTDTHDNQYNHDEAYCVYGLRETKAKTINLLVELKHKSCLTCIRPIKQNSSLKKDSVIGKEGEMSRAMEDALIVRIVIKENAERSKYLGKDVKKLRKFLR